MQSKFKTISVIGLGLIGGSLAWAFKKKKIAKVIGISRRRKSINYALKKGIIDWGTTNLKKGVENADLILLAGLISKIVPTFKKIQPYLKNGSIVTDVGSTKKHIVKEIEKNLRPDIYFIGGHPMAGKETRGIEEADVNLFQGKPYILIKTKKTHPLILDELKTILEKLGAKILIISPDIHDKAVSLISHLPFLISSTLVKTVNEGRGKIKKIAFQTASSGFRDTTRIAASPADLWTEIIFSNKENILEALKNYKKNLSKIENLVKQNEVKKILKIFDNNRNIRI